MSESLSFEQSVVDAADCYVAQMGYEAAIAELEERRSEEPQNDRVHEALAYLRYQEGSEDV